jgi:hypothetical protein
MFPETRLGAQGERLRATCRSIQRNRVVAAKSEALLRVFNWVSDFGFQNSSMRLLRAPALSHTLVPTVAFEH